MYVLDSVHALFFFLRMRLIHIYHQIVIFFGATGYIPKIGLRISPLTTYIFPPWSNRSVTAAMEVSRTHTSMLCVWMDQGFVKSSCLDGSRAVRQYETQGAGVTRWRGWINPLIGFCALLFRAPSGHLPSTAEWQCLLQWYYNRLSEQKHEERMECGEEWCMYDGWRERKGTHKCVCPRLSRRKPIYKYSDFRAVPKVL